MIVVDASVAAKWFLPEADSAAALRLLRSSEKLVAPELIRTEVTSAILRRCRVGELSADWARKSRTAWLSALERDVVFLHPNATDLLAGSELALQFEHPLADCLYLALSHRLGVPLITSDAKFANKVPHEQGTIITLPAFAASATA